MKAQICGLRLSGLPSPNVEKAEPIKIETGPVLVFHNCQVIRVEGLLISQAKSEVKYRAVICQDPPEYFCDCADYQYRKNFCKHLSRLLLSISMEHQHAEE